MPAWKGVVSNAEGKKKLSACRNVMCLQVSGSKAALYLWFVKLWVQLFLCVYYINDNVIFVCGGGLPW